MLCNLADGAKADWKASVVKAVHAYNCMRSEARLLTVGAYKLLLTSSCFGETPDSLFRWFLVSQPKAQSPSHQDYTEKWKACMKNGYKLASATAYKES